MDTSPGSFLGLSSVSPPLWGWQFTSYDNASFWFSQIYYLNQGFCFYLSKLLLIIVGEGWEEEMPFSECYTSANPVFTIFG